MKVFRGPSAIAQRAAAIMIMAAVTCAAKQQPPVDQEVLNNSASILGRIGVAKLALAYGLKGEAQANIKSAIDTAEVLKASASRFSLKDPMPFGRLSYKTSDGAGQSYVPFIGNYFTARILDEKLLKSGATKTELTDAQIASAQVSIDGNELKADLGKAEAALKMGKPEDALAALNAITDSSLTPAAAEPGTLQLARQSLALAQQLLKDKDYKAAAFAAGHAKDALSAAAGSDAALKARAADTDKAIKGLDDLGDSIRSGKPSGQKSPDAAASDLAKQLESLSPKG